jgi:hypothetical protein
MPYSTHPGAIRSREWRKANPEANTAMRARYRLGALNDRLQLVG